MKFAIAYYFMLIYFTVIFKPLIPIASNIFAHAFQKEIHEAVVHGKYGNNHLKTELAANGAENDNSKKHHTSQLEKQVVVHVLSCGPTYDFSQNSAKENHYVQVGCLFLNAFISRQVPPPRFIV